MSGLAELQRDLQRHVLSGDAAIAAAVNGTAAVPAATRLGVYSNAYRIRLADALGDNMPHLRTLLGEEEFQAVAARYIEEHPSQFASIRWPTCVACRSNEYSSSISPGTRARATISSTRTTNRFAKRSGSCMQPRSHASARSRP